MFRNGLQGWHILVLLVVILLLFGAQRLPGLARSVGESLRIFKKEIKDVAADDAPSDGTRAATPNPTTDPASPPATSTGTGTGTAPDVRAEKPYDTPGRARPE